MTIERAPQRKCSRMASGSEQYRIFRSRTSSSSALPREIALPTTTKSMIGGDVVRAVAAQHGDAFGREEVAHRRIHVLIRSADVEALALQHRGQRRHGRAADADQMDSAARLTQSTAASSMTRRGVRPRRRGTRRRAAASWPVRSCGPTESRPAPDRESRRTDRPSPRGAVGCPTARRTAAARRSRSPRARASSPVCRSCVTIRSSRYGRSPTSSRNRT